MIASELLHTIRKKREKGALLMAKMNLSKVYDRVAWSFVKQTLMKHNFPPLKIS